MDPDYHAQLHIPGFYHPRLGYKTGVGAFKAFTDVLLNCKELSTCIKPFHLLYQHVKMMQIRTKYLYERKIIGVQTQFLSKIMEIEKRYEVFERVLIKEAVKDRGRTLKLSDQYAFLLDAYGDWLFSFMDMLNEHIEQKQHLKAEQNSLS